MLTEWTLRQVAAGPVHAHRAEQQRAQHRQRTAAGREPRVVGDAAEDTERVVTASGPVDPKMVARLNAAFPTTSKQALNAPGKSTALATRPGQLRERTKAREHSETVRD